jgi:hypothetical protein
MTPVVANPPLSLHDGRFADLQSRVPRRVSALGSVQVEGILGKPTTPDSPEAAKERASMEKERKQAISDMRAAMEFLQPGNEAALRQALAWFDKRLLDVSV